MPSDEIKDGRAPTCEDIRRLARHALSALPEKFASQAKLVALQVEETAHADVLETLGIEDELELTGLYEGVPLPEKSVMDQPNLPDIIYLFRRPILHEWRERGNCSLQELVSHVFVHELAHHFGWSDQDIAQIDRWWE